MSVHAFHDPALRSIDVGEGLAVVVFADPLEPGNVGFRHECGRWPDDQEPDGEFVKVVAPRLSLHTITGPEEALTIRASILCSACGLHGHVTDGVWTPV